MEAQALTAPEPGFLEGVRELCTKYGALLIFDEVVTGFRWSLGGASEYYGVTPDLCCLGKALANGMPLSAIAGIKDLAEKYNLKINFAGSAPRHNLTFDSSYKDPKGLKALFYQEMVKQGILFPNVIYIQFSHTEKDIKKTIKAADKSFKFVADNIDNIDEVLEGKKSIDIFRKNT